MNPPSVETQVLFSGHGPTITSLDVHPVKPWIVTGHEDSSVIVWDYENSSIVYEINFNNYFDGKDTNWLQSEEKESDWSYKAPQNLVKLEKPKVGAVRHIRFYDQQTKLWKGFNQKEIGQADSRELKGKPDLSSDERSYIPPNWIIVCAEQRTIFLDYVSFQIKDIETTLAFKTAISYVEFWSKGTNLAFGGADGLIVIWDYKDWVVVKKLNAHKAPIIKMLAYEECEITHLISLSSDGTQCVWNILASTDKPIVQKKVHSGDITLFSYNPLNGDLISLGSDKVLYFWNLYGSKEKAKIKIGFKGTFSNADLFLHPRVAQNSIIACTGSDAKVYLLDTEFTKEKDKENVRELVDLSSFLQKGKKNKAAKFSSLRVHPLCPHILICTTKSRVVVFNVEIFWSPNFVISEYKGPQSKPMFLTAINDSLLSTELDSEKLKNATLQLISQMEKSGSEIKLQISSSGRYVSMHWVENYRLVVWDLMESKIVEEGSVKSCAWSSYGDRLVFLDIQIAEQESGGKKKGFFDFGKKKGKTGPTPPPKIVLKMQNYAERDPKTKKPSETTEKTIVPIETLFGGLLLGAVSESSDSDKDNDERRLQFYNWSPFTAVGGPLPRPFLVLWDPTEAYCFISFRTYSCVFSVRPFKMVCHLPFVVQSALWFNRSLIFSTTKDIQCLFPPVCVPLILTSFNPTIPFLLSDKDKSKVNEFIVNSIVFSDKLRPPGAVSIVKIINEDLVILDAQKKFHSISLSHPLLKFYFLVAAGLTADGMKWAKYVPAKYHKKLCHFLIQMGYPKEACQLDISDSLKWSICLKYKQYDTAINMMKKFNSMLKNNPSDFIDAAGGEQIEQALWLANSAVDTSSFQLAESLYFLIAEMEKLYEIEESMGYRNLALMYVAQEDMSSLHDLYTRQLELKHFDDAKFSAIFFDDSNSLMTSLEKSSNFAELLALTGSSTTLSKWNSKVNTKYPGFAPLTFVY